MFERKRVLVVIRASVLDTYLDATHSVEAEDMEEIAEQLLGEEDSEDWEEEQGEDEVEEVEIVDADEVEIHPNDVVIPLIQANRLGSSKRMAVLRISQDWVRVQKKAILVEQGVPMENIIPNDLEAVLLSDEDRDYFLAMTHVSVVVGSIDWGADDMQNFDPPPYSDVHAWVQDVPDRIFEPLFNASLIVNGHWSFGEAEKNLIMPG